MPNAKIVCTLGPATDSRGAIADLVEAGMSVARINATHGTPEARADLVETVRQVDAASPEPVATMLDLQGPEVRTAAPAEGALTLEDGREVTFVAGDEVGPDTVGLSEPLKGVSAGDTILVDDGRIEATILGVEGEVVTARIESGGALSGRKGVAVPNVDMGLAPVTEKDREDIAQAVDLDVDLLAASFVRNAEDVLAVGEAVEAAGGDLPIVAKVERSGAVENLAGIVEAAYGVMVARGDLGVEYPMEEVPMIQKRIIRRCHEAGVPVITATEMLDSMVTERRPTRAEASDVANAVLDGTDAVMLSAETAVGDHPVRVVEAMDAIIREVEDSDEYAELREQRVPQAGDARTDALARSARYLARDIGAAAVVAVSESGYTALKTAKFRPGVPVVATTPDEAVCRRLALSWGVIPRHVPLATEGADEVIDTAVQAALDADVAESGDTVVVLSGMMTGLEGTTSTNLLKMHVAAERLASGRAVVPGRATGPLARTADGDLEGVPEGAILAVEPGFDGEFEGDVRSLSGIIDAKPGMTGYPAMIARELEIPMVSGAELERDVQAGTVVTLDAERGVLYEGDIASTRTRS